MSEMALHNLILYNLLNMANLNKVLILHCWSAGSLQRFAHLANSANCYTQYIDLNQQDSLPEKLKMHLIEHKLTKLGVFLDLRCNQSVEVMDIANNMNLYTENYHWMLYDQYADISNITQYYERAQLSINTDLCYIYINTSSESSTSFILNDLYNKGVHLGAKLNITRDQEIACNETKCHLKRYLSDLYKRSRFQQRKWLTGLTLRMTAVVSTLPLNTTPEAEIIEFLESISDIHIDSFARFGYQSRQALKDMLGCHFAYIFRDRWTSAEITGGLIGDLLNETADISVSPFIYTSARAPYFRALTQFSTFRSIGMFLNAPSGKLRSTEFLQPFSPSVWLMFGALLFVAGVLLWITFRLERQCSFNISLLTSCLISFGVACIQGAWLMPRSTGGRMAFYFLMLTSFMMYNYYTSIVVSTLLGKPAHSNIRTVQQLADSALDVSIETTPYVWGYVQSSGRPDIRSLYHNKVVKSNRPLEDILMAGEEGVLKVRNYPGHVFLAEATTAYEFVRKHFMPHQICALNEILLRAETATHTLVNKRSPYVELFKLSELRMMETGVQMKHERYWRRIKLHCYQSNVTVDVGLDYAAPLFLILLCAYIFCMCIFLMEIVWHKRERLRRNRVR